MLRPISRATAEWPFFAVTLADAGLPVEDLDGAGQRFFALGDSLAFGGYLITGPDALMRSIVVPPSAQKRGLGQAVVTALLRQLEGQGVERAWLLTTSAGPFFERLGFAHADRSDAPPLIAATPQFRGICPSNAAFMCCRVAAATSKGPSA